MLNRFNATEWQSFSIKKDIENININTKHSKEFQLTALSEISLALIGVSGSYIVDNSHINKYWLIVSIILLLPVVILLLTRVIMFLYKQVKPGKDLMNRKSLIDLFDNEICYYAMMAESYYQMYVEGNNSESISRDRIIIDFYAIESIYYIQKVIQNLNFMSSSPRRIYSDNVDQIMSQKMVSVFRLFNLLDMIDSLMKAIEDSDVFNDSVKKNESNPKGIDYNLYSRYKKLYRIFKDSVIREFPLLKDYINK